MIPCFTTRSFCYLCLLLFILHFTYTIIFFFFNDTATTEIYTLSLHDALPILLPYGADNDSAVHPMRITRVTPEELRRVVFGLDRKSTRLNSSHVEISYAVFCLKKKKNKKRTTR